MGNKNLTVGDLKEILGMLDDKTPVIIPVIDEENCNHILAFRHVRTAGILECQYEREDERFALCLNAATDENDLYTQILKRKSDIICKEVLR